VRKELKELSKSLGFQYTPLEEIENRFTRIRTGMKKQEMDALLVVQKMNFYYLSGTTQDGLLFVPSEGKPLLMIKRELERSKVESPIKDVIALNQPEIPPNSDPCGKLPNSLGLELISFRKDYFKFQELFSKTSSWMPPIMRETGNKISLRST
jgi:Xaa-Pro aminopeptidase